MLYYADWKVLNLPEVVEVMTREEREDVRTGWLARSGKDELADEVAVAAAVCLDWNSSFPSDSA